jgi:hypothetical protein
MSVQINENGDHTAALKIQNWWRNLYRNYDSSETESESDSDSSDNCSDSSSGNCSDSDIYPRTHHNYQEIPEIQEKSFCNSLLGVFVEVTIVILLPIVYFRVKNYFN